MNGSDADPVGVLQTFIVLGGDLLRVHGGRRLRLPRAARRLAARRLDAAGRADATRMITQHHVHLKTP